MMDIIDTINNVIKHYPTYIAAGLSIAAGVAIGVYSAQRCKDSDIGLKTGLESVIKETIGFIEDTYGELYIARGRGRLPSPFADPDVQRAINDARRQGVQLVEKWPPYEGHAVMVGGRMFEDRESGKRDWYLADIALYSENYKTMLVYKNFPKTANAWRKRIFS